MDKPNSAVPMVVGNLIFWPTVIWGFATGHIGWAALILVGATIAGVIAMRVFSPESLRDEPTERGRDTPVRRYVTIARPADQVWASLTTKGTWGKWWARLASVTPGWEVGAAMEWEYGDGSTITKLKPGRTLVVSGGSIEMRIQLRKMRGGTEVCLEERPINGIFWTDGGYSRLEKVQTALDRLRDAVEKSAPA